MFDVLDIINEATKEANSFENHAAKSLSLEERLLYLQGLALVMNADSEIHEDEKEYIRILIKSFDMDESLLETFVEFAQAPDKDTVQAFFKTFRRRQIAQLFLFDALMMSRRDGNGCEREQAVIDKIAEQLEVLKGTYSDIYDLFCHIKNKNWDESALYFSSHLLNPDHFKHLLYYFDVDFDELMARTDELRVKRLLQALSAKMPELTGSGKVKPKLDHDIVIPMLQSELDRGNGIVVNDFLTISDNEEFGELILKNEGIGWNKEQAYLYSLTNKVITNENIMKLFSELMVSLGLSEIDVVNIIYSNEINIITGVVHAEYKRILNLPTMLTRDGSIYIEIENDIYKYSPGEHYDAYGVEQILLESAFERDSGIINIWFNEWDSNSRGSLTKLSMINEMLDVGFNITNTFKIKT